MAERGRTSTRRVNKRADFRGVRYPVSGAEALKADAEKKVSRRRRASGRERIPKAAGAENITLSAAKIMSSEHVDLPEWAGYYEKIQVSVSESIRKKAYMATFSVI